MCEARFDDKAVFAGDAMRFEDFRDALESKASTFNLVPGMGVHQPFIAPHRVYTGQELSVTLAVSE